MNQFLIVDDCEMSRLMLEDLLSTFAQCDMAASGIEALLLFEKALSVGRPYNLICVDLLMPEMNGLAFIRRIRDIEKTQPALNGSRTLIFVISASESAWDKADLILDNLCDDYIVKPLDRGLLVANLYKYSLVPPLKEISKGSIFS